MQQNPCKHCSISEMYDRVKHSLDKKLREKKLSGLVSSVHRTLISNHPKEKNCWEFKTFIKYFRELFF